MKPLRGNVQGKLHGQGGDERQTFFRRITSNGQNARLVRVNLTGLFGGLVITQLWIIQDGLKLHVLPFNVESFVRP